jgi:hypothetical protein
MGQYDLPRSPQRAVPVTPTVPVPPEIWKPTADAPYNASALEALIDQFIAANKLGAGAQFQIPYPGGAKTFEYLGPESGGRKDWMEKGPPSAAPLTS